ncbi:MAG: ribosome maturation factor RimP [Alphaproteobacteria bacterium]|nr:ribosome maturation factor RimP [Alphaproteobacteria bacterium]
MSESALERRVAELVEPMLTGMGYELVRVRMSAGGGRTLQIMAERADRSSMTVDDCADISRAVSALIDVEDPITGAYDLEVSSPGIDRPLVRPRDFERFAGYEAKIETRAPVDGRRRFRGRLLGLADERVRIRLADGSGEVALAVDMIEKAKLVVTDDLIAGDLHAAEAG